MFLFSLKCCCCCCYSYYLSMGMAYVQYLKNRVRYGKTIYNKSPSPPPLWKQIKDNTWRFIIMCLFSLSLSLSLIVGYCFIYAVVSVVVCLPLFSSPSPSFLSLSLSLSCVNLCLLLLCRHLHPLGISIFYQLLSHQFDIIDLF